MYNYHTSSDNIIISILYRLKHNFSYKSNIKDTKTISNTTNTIKIDSKGQ